MVTTTRHTCRERSTSRTPRSALAPRLPDKTLPIVVYCASETCRNSHTAAALLRNLGYESVAVYDEGKAGWVASGRSLLRAAA